MAIYSKSNTFSANTLIQSAQVNTNFDEISTAINTTLFSGTSDALLATKGGTSFVSYTTGNILYASATNVLSKLAIGAEGTVLTSTSGVPAWGTAPVTAATQADQETGTSTSLFVSPGRQQYHASAAKAWGMLSYGGSAVASYNVASVTDSGAGSQTPIYTTAFSTANYSIVASAQSDAAGSSATTFVCQINNSGKAAGQCVIQTLVLSTYAGADANYSLFAAFGDQ